LKLKKQVHARAIELFVGVLSLGWSKRDRSYRWHDVKAMRKSSA